MEIYGITNCNTVKKALDWFNANQVDFNFHNFKKEGVTAEKLAEWTAQVSWEKLLNKNGLTWKKLDGAEKEKVNDEASAILLMQEKTSSIKRPVIEFDGKIILGFDEEQYRSLFLGR